MFKYIGNYIDLPYLHKQGSYFSVNWYFAYNLLSKYSKEINTYDNSLENAVDFYCADQKKKCSHQPTTTLILWNQLTKLL